MEKMRKRIFIICGVIVACVIIISYAISLRNRDNEYQNLIRNGSTISNVSYYNQYDNNQTNEYVDSVVKIDYQENTVRKVSSVNGNFLCTENVPVLTGIDQNIANKIQQYIKRMYQKEWNDINAQTSDDYIKKILNSDKNFDGQTSIGFKQTAKMIYKTDKVISFETYLSGNIGGVSWDKSEGVSFDIKTGDVIDIDEIVTSEDAYIEACKRYVFPLLRNDKRAQYFNKGYESAVNAVINEKNGYFTRDGIKCVKISGYKISDVLTEEFEFTIPYKNIKDCIKSEYLPNS